MQLVASKDLVIVGWIASDSMDGMKFPSSMECTFGNKGLTHEGLENVKKWLQDYFEP